VVVLLLLPLSSAMDDGKFDGGSLATVAVAAVAAMDNNWRKKRPATRASMVA
jgi:hypothetical protein